MTLREAVEMYRLCIEAGDASEEKCAICLLADKKFDGASLCSFLTLAQLCLDRE